MSFSLLAPAALGLLALAAGPVLAHLTRQVIREERTFGATLLLERLTTRLERRRRLSDRRLLMLRVLALLLGLCAWAQPELRWPETRADLGGTGRVVVVLDTSMSMDQRGVADGDASAFDEARAAAVAMVGGLPDGTRVAVVTTAPPAVRADWTDGSAGARASAAAQLDAAARTDGAGDLHGALVLARGLMQGEAAEVVVYTDESGPGQVAACASDIERIVAVGGALVPRVFAPSETANIAVANATYGDGLEGGSVRVQLRSYGEAAREVTTTLTLPAPAGGGPAPVLTSFSTVPGATAEGPGALEVRFTVPRQSAGGVASVRVGDAALPADNVRYFHLPRIGASRVLVIDGDPGSTPTRAESYFLARALAPVGLGRPAVDVVAPAGVSVLDPAVHRVVWMANVADPAALVPRLLGFVRKGGGLVIGMGDNVTPERYDAVMEELLPAPLRRVRDLADAPGTVGAPLAPVEPSELLAPFDATPAAFAGVHARRVMTVEPGADADTVLRWEGGLPALVRRTVGAGQVVLWTSTLDLGWGNFPVQAVFPAFVDRVTSVLGGETSGGGAAAAGVVGEPLTVAVPVDAPELVLTGPDGAIRAAERAGGALRVVPDVAGAWTASGAGQVEVASIAVNPPASESDVRRGDSLAARQAALAPDRMTVRFGLSAWLLGAAALALLAAAAWAGRPVTGEADDAAA